jgi:protein ImuB
LILFSFQQDGLGASEVDVSRGEIAQTLVIAAMVVVIDDEHRLYRFAPVASDVPERSVQRIAPAAPKTGETWPDPWLRPARLLPRPEPIATLALLPDHPPVTFTWRGIRRRVKRADGPERVFGERWKQDAELSALRDYFRVEDEAGERFWIYRASDGEDTITGSHRWFLHGIFG